MFYTFSNLSNNKISEIEDGAFEGASSVVELHLTANHLESVRGSMFKGMEGLRMLWVYISAPNIHWHYKSSIFTCILTKNAQKMSL